MLPPDAVWFITGCSSGIGLALAQLVASKPGHRLVATARDVSSLSSHLPSETDNPNVVLLPLDVTSKPSVDTALAKALEKFSRIDVLINNAGINTFGITESFPESDMRAIMETNFWGPMHLTRKAVGIMRDINANSRGGIGGSIINVTSIGGRVAYQVQAAYHASKYALEGFTEAMASELPSEWNIRVMLLEPGGTKSRLAEQANGRKRPGHPAYEDPAMLVNRVLKALADPKAKEGWVDADGVARCVVELLMREEQELPFRLVTGADGWDVVWAKEEGRRQELLKWKEWSEGVGRGKIFVENGGGLEG